MVDHSVRWRRESHYWWLGEGVTRGDGGGRHAAPSEQLCGAKLGQATEWQFTPISIQDATFSARYERNRVEREKTMIQDKDDDQSSTQLPKLILKECYMFCPCWASIPVPSSKSTATVIIEIG